MLNYSSKLNNGTQMEIGFQKMNINTHSFIIANVYCCGRLFATFTYFYISHTLSPSLSLFI